MNRSDVELLEHETVFQGYFRVDRYRLRHRLFGGGWSPPIEREIFERGHAVAILMYDPDRDAVVLTEQFRSGPYASGDNPWLLEIAAGIIEEGEAPENVAHREAMEETGCALEALVPIAEIYTSPGGTSESMVIYCARVDSGSAGGVHGVADESEDIRVVVLPAEEAIAAVSNGRVKSGPAVIALQWLALNRRSTTPFWPEST